MADVMDLTEGGADRRGRRALEEVIVIDDDDEVVAPARGAREKGKEEGAPSHVASKPKRAKTKRDGDGKPVWQGLNGARRLMAEFKEIQVLCTCVKIGALVRF